MKEYIYKLISHPIDLYQEMEQLNESANSIEGKGGNLGTRELLDLGNDNWAIYSSVSYFENIKQTMQPNYIKNWMRLMYVRNENDDMLVDVEISLANQNKLVNEKNLVLKPSRAKSGFNTKVMLEYYLYF